MKRVERVRRLGVTGAEGDEGESLEDGEAVFPEAFRSVRRVFGGIWSALEVLEVFNVYWTCFEAFSPGFISFRKRPTAIQIGSRCCGIFART